ncbi:hypothetical protein QR680_013241 [Steinernema hermaphroditum]|uniref:Tetratricopeptide repeat protein 9C n=1 Tax=Steinernema hermaphroditum TaxID=289476 RepID=A0AA39I4V0_9BILA|nr:hypothetical protein QR680_013241 [Steinernema hermaphroditum]
MATFKYRTIAEDRELLDQANQLKDEANASYSKQEYINAAKLYHRCLLLVKSCAGTPLGEMFASLGDPDSDGAGEQTGVSEERENIKKEASHVVAKCYNNLAACILARNDRKPSDYERAVDYCQRVLNEDKDNEKALYRTGIAYMRMEKYGKAVDFLSKCPNNRDAAQQVIVCQQKLRDDRIAREEVIRRNFAKAQAREQGQQNPSSNGNLLQ